MVKINWVCFGNHSGYSQAAQDMIFALHKSGKYDMRMEYLLAGAMPQSGVSPKRKDILMDMIKKPRIDAIQVYQCIPIAQHNVPAMKRNIGYAMFETFNPPNEGPMNWISLLNRNDAIIAPSEFNYKIFAHEKISKPLFYIPCCYDREQFNDSVEPLEKRKRFSFLYFGTWKLRKGYPALIEAFCREFNSKENVQLVIKTDHIQQAKASIDGIKKKLGLDKKDCAPIILENRIFDEVSLPRFIKSFDCLISPTLGEGFGLPGLQCMALGVPVAITDFSGCKDYAMEETCTLIKPAGFVLHPGIDDLPQFMTKKWAFISCSEIRRVLRHVLSNSVEIKSKTEYAKQFVEKKFSYEAAEKSFSEMLRLVFNV